MEDERRRKAMRYIRNDRREYERRRKQGNTQEMIEEKMKEGENQGNT